MKKFFAIAALAVASLTVNAQTWIGGSFGFNWDKSKADHGRLLQRSVTTSTRHGQLPSSSVLILQSKVIMML